jgi:hypothetical protein
MKSTIEECIKLPHAERGKKLRNLKLPTIFKEEFTFFTRPGGKLDIDFLIAANRNTQNDYLEYLREQPLVMTEQLKGRLSASKSIIAKLLKRRNLDTSECNYVAINASGQLTFHPKPWMQTFDKDGDFNKEGRQAISLAKLLRRLGLISARSTKLLAPHIEQCTHAFVNEYKLEETTFKKAYSYPKDGDSWTSSSCMRGKNVGPFYEAMGGIPMLLLQDGNVVGRFIKWNTPDGVFFDRLYFKEEKHFNWLKSYCKDNNIGAHHEGKTRSMPSPVDMDFDEFVPYMDTWKYYSPDLQTFFTSHDGMGAAKDAVHYFLESQEGGYNQHNKGNRLCAKTGRVYPTAMMTKQRSGEFAGRYIKKEDEISS